MSIPFLENLRCTWMYPNCNQYSIGEIWQCVKVISSTLHLEKCGNLKHQQAEDYFSDWFAPKWYQQYVEIVNGVVKAESSISPDVASDFILYQTDSYLKCARVCKTAFEFHICVFWAMKANFRVHKTGFFIFWPNRHSHEILPWLLICLLPSCNFQRMAISSGFMTSGCREPLAVLTALSLNQISFI